jgi:hypothetical protein
MSEKVASKGTKLQLSIESVYTDIGGVNKIDYPDREVETWDATDLDSDVREDGELTGYVTTGMIGGECFYDPEDEIHQEMEELLNTPDYRDWRIRKGTRVVTVNGALKKFQPTAAVGDGMKATFEIKCRTKPVISTVV